MAGPCDEADAEEEAMMGSSRTSPSSQGSGREGCVEV